MRVRIVDRNLNTRLPREEGELLLGGDCLAAGYIHRPELTEERFIELEGSRWYRTGDIATLGSDGELEYLGRLDDQIKLNGFRIEPAEIESTLSRHEAVAVSAVVVVESTEGKQLVAHVAPRRGQADDALAAQLLAHCKAHLPPYLIPQRILIHAALPLTPAGKIDRRALKQGSDPKSKSMPWHEAETIEGRLSALWMQLLGISNIDTKANLFDLGARSLTVVQAVTELRRHGFHKLTAAQIYEHSSIARLSAFLTAMPATSATVRVSSGTRPAAAGSVVPLQAARGEPLMNRDSSVEISGVAIVGMAGRFPGASNVEEFWANLLAGRESITRFSSEDLSPQVPAELRRHPRYVPARGVIADADRFDASFFGISPREALLMDPQQRVFLELCWNALEHAGVDPERFAGSIGVYAGVSNNGYRKLVDSRPDLVRGAGEFATMVANEKDYVATRVAHRMNLTGPALSIHTACSTSLVAIAQAWYALMSWQCDMALAGGMNIVVPQESGYVPVEGGMESGDGHCRPFDANANGTVFSSGGAVVALKRLSDAIEQGDMIWAVIRGVGINNDGADKASFTAPSARGQAAVIRQALATAGVEARSIGYVEAHGTGTSLGDPIEVEALTRAFREDTAENQFCWLGSAKSNLGHLVAGSGVTGLIKAALALHHGRIPPTLHYQIPNPEIDFGATPFKVANAVIPWPRGTAPRRAGVSSFGVGGTNAHVVLEEAPPPGPPAPARPMTLLTLSARDEQTLKRRASDLAVALQDRKDAELADIGYTLAQGRRPMVARGAIVARNIAEAREKLASIAARVARPAPRLVFLFPGQGSQHPNMASVLIDTEPVFKNAFDTCCALASEHLGRDLRKLIFPESRQNPSDETALMETRYTQPALFAVEYALAELWESWGYRPVSMIGHSIGEYVAACRAGVFSLEVAVALVVARGAAMFAQPPGSMLAVHAGQSDVAQRLPHGVEIAALNAPGSNGSRRRRQRHRAVCRSSCEGQC